MFHTITGTGKRPPLFIHLLYPSFIVLLFLFLFLFHLNSSFISILLSFQFFFAQDS